MFDHCATLDSNISNVGNCFMDSVQVHSASHVARMSDINASPDVSGSHSGRAVVLSQPSCCQCPANTPPPSYEEATRPTQIINPAQVSFLLNESQGLIRDNERESRAKEKKCCAGGSDGCCGDLVEICCYLTCYLLLGLLK